MMDDLQDIEEDGMVDDTQHENLLNTVAQLDGKRAKLKQRREPRSEASEFGLGTSTKKARVLDVVRNLKNREAHREIKKKIKKYSKNKKPLPAPLPRVKESRIKRQVAYTKVQKELGAWQSVVEKNRLAEQTFFPLQRPDVRLVTAEEFGSKFKPKTALELEVSKILEESPHNLKKELTDFEKQAIAAMSLEKARETKMLLCKTRALESYKAAKAKRLNSIKSKKYHKILKRERIKQHLAEFEALRKSNPAAAEKKLEELEQIRMQERMSLKHRSTGKWAKSRAIRAKYDKESREAIAEQLRLNRELKQKWDHLAKHDSEESTDEEEGEASGDEPTAEESSFKDSMEKLKKLARTNINSDTKNTTTDTTHVGSDVQPTTRTDNEDRCTEPTKDDSCNSEERKSRKKEKLKRIRKAKWFVVDKEGKTGRKGTKEDEWKEGGLEETLVKKAQVNDFQIMDKEERRIDVNVDKKSEKGTNVKNKRKEEEPADIDPGKFVAKVALKSRVHDFVNYGNEGMDDSDEDDEETKKKHLIAEAFADDDVMVEFRKEKEDEIKDNTLQDENLCLPGWGDWGGSGLEAEYEKKKRLFTLRAPPRQPRRDDHIGNVILREDRDEKLRKHQVSQLPFPFSTVADFESSIRQPIGKTWIPETAHMKLTEPKILTLSGTVIKPMNKSDVFKKNVKVK